MPLSTAKSIEVLFDDAMDTHEEQMQMATMIEDVQLSNADMQNSRNIFWRQVQQQAEIVEGFTINDNQFGDVIELSYPSMLPPNPYNTPIVLRSDDLRDERFLARKITEAVKRLGSDQNQRIASLVTDTGSLFYRSAAGTAGYNFVREAKTLLSERQLAMDSGISYFLNNRTASLIEADLANRSNIAGLPDSVYTTGMLGHNVAGFDIYEGAYLPSLAGGALTGVTVATTVSQAPEALDSNNMPIDYRIGTITVSSAANINAGDKLSFTGVRALGLQDKTVTTSDFTCSVISKAGNVLTVYPKPIALNDSALSASQLAYANINTQITAGTAVTRLNSDTAAMSNVFWCNDSVEIVNGDVNAEVLGDSSLKVLNRSMSSGTKVTLAYSGSINSLNLQVRLIAWYGLVNRDPMRNGVGLLATS